MFDGAQLTASANGMLNYSSSASGGGCAGVECSWVTAAAAGGVEWQQGTSHLRHNLMTDFVLHGVGAVLVWPARMSNQLLRQRASAPAHQHPHVNLLDPAIASASSRHCKLHAPRRGWRSRTRGKGGWGQRGEGGEGVGGSIHPQPCLKDHAP